MPAICPAFRQDAQVCVDDFVLWSNRRSLPGRPKAVTGLSRELPVHAWILVY